MPQLGLFVTDWWLFVIMIIMMMIIMIIMIVIIIMRPDVQQFDQIFNHWKIDLSFGSGHFY